MSEEKTVALRATVSFNGLNVGDIIHVDPDDLYYGGLINGGFLAYAYPEDDPAAVATILQVNHLGDATTIIGVRPARQRRTRTAQEDTDGTPDPESA